MNDNWFPFGMLDAKTKELNLNPGTGVGIRSCAGRALADLELGLVTAIIVKNFRIRLHETTTPDSMRLVN